jgi:hypothetical protein
MTIEVNGDVWKFETGDQDWASDDLSIILQQINNTIPTPFGQRMKLIKYVRSLWDNEPWDSIKEKLGAEGSRWYVWTMDGLNKHLRNLKQWEIERENNAIDDAAKNWNPITLPLSGQDIAVIFRAFDFLQEHAHGAHLRTLAKELATRIQTAENYGG